MIPSNMTMEERERWAYANGDVQTARALGEALDALDDAREAGYEDGRADGENAGREQGRGDAIVEMRHALDAL